MRTGREQTTQRSLSEAGWFVAALVLGALWGLTVEPVPLPALDMPGAAQLKLLGWLVVGVLCLCVGAVGWLILSSPSPIAAFGGEMGFESPQAPHSQAGRPAFGARAKREPAFPAAEAIPREILFDAPVSAMPASGIIAETKAAESKDPFLAALDYLGHAQATVRIGGILALERAAKNSDDLSLSAGTLAAYIQQWAATDTQARRNRPGFDVTAALAVVSRLLPSGDAVRNHVDLRRTCLAGLELPDADLSRFHLEHADLAGADLRGTNLGGVNFRGASLRGALLAGADFTGASLRGADMSDAVLSDEEFGAADLSQCGNLSAAQLLHIRYAAHLPPRLPPGMQA